MIGNFLPLGFAVAVVVAMTFPLPGKTLQSYQVPERCIT